MEQRLPAWARALIVAQAALALILFTVAAEKAAIASELTETARSICGQALVAIEMDIRGGKAVQESDLYALSTITALYPESPQAMLAEEFLHGELAHYRELTQEKQELLADLIGTFYDQDTNTEALEENYEQIREILFEIK